jgi:hypothetical protein
MALKKGEHDMSADERADETYDQLLAINMEAFGEADYETACHALNAALNRAHHLGDVRRVEVVGQRAGEQLEWLEAHPPGDALPTVRGVRRGTLRSLYSSITREAPLLADLVRHERHLAQPGRGSGKDVPA